MHYLYPRKINKERGGGNRSCESIEWEPSLLACILAFNQNMSYKFAEIIDNNQMDTILKNKMDNYFYSLNFDGISLSMLMNLSPAASH